MKKTFKYTKHKYMPEYRFKQSNKWDFLCEDSIDEFFDVPEDTKTIWITVSDEPMEESYECHLGGLSFKDVVLTLSNRSRRPQLIVSEVYNKLEQLFGEDGIFYVKVEY